MQRLWIACIIGSCSSLQPMSDLIRTRRCSVYRPVWRLQWRQRISDAMHADWCRQTAEPVLHFSYQRVSYRSLCFAVVWWELDVVVTWPAADNAFGCCSCCCHCSCRCYHCCCSCRCVFAALLVVLAAKLVLPLLRLSSTCRSPVVGCCRAATTVAADDAIDQRRCCCSCCCCRLGCHRCDNLRCLRVGRSEGCYCCCRYRCWSASALPYRDDVLPLNSVCSWPPAC